MQTVTITIDDAAVMKALEDMERKHFIKIVETNNFDSPAIPGTPLSLDQFKKWIKDAEDMPTVSLEEAKSRWARKRKMK